MASKPFGLGDVLIDQKLDMMRRVVHQAQDADRAGRQIQIFSQQGFIRKG